MMDDATSESKFANFSNQHHQAQDNTDSENRDDDSLDGDRRNTRVPVTACRQIRRLGRPIQTIRIRWPSLLNI